MINHSVARSGDDHVHRIGRTGRAGARGLAITLVAPQEWNQMQSIERYLKLEVETRAIKGLESRFKGPSSRGGKKTDKERKAKKKVVPKAKQRHSFKKNIGKRRQPAGAAEEKREKTVTPGQQSGFQPLKKKT